MNILESLWFGDIRPHEQYIVQTEERQELHRLISVNEKQMLETMTAEQRALFDKYENCVSEMSVLTERDCFIIGYRLGVQLTAAAMGHEE